MSRWNLFSLVLHTYRDWFQYSQQLHVQNKRESPSSNLVPVYHQLTTVIFSEYTTAYVIILQQETAQIHSRYLMNLRSYDLVEDKVFQSYCVLCHCKS